jgi:hypothetical protein
VETFYCFPSPIEQDLYQDELRACASDIDEREVSTCFAFAARNKSLLPDFSHGYDGSMDGSTSYLFE